MKKIILGVIIAIAAFFLLSVASCFITPPSSNEVETFLKENADNLLLVNRYLADSDYDFIQIDDPNEMYADFNYVVLDDKTVSNAVQDLMENKGVRNIYKDGNTIEYELWRFTETLSGITYSINKEDLPDVQYLTELLPLSEEGWYYYVSDYRTWRNNKTEDGSLS